MNISDACSLAVEGETDKFCEVAEENDLSDDIASPKFPVVLCHSPGASRTRYIAYFFLPLLILFVLYCRG